MIIAFLVGLVLGFLHFGGLWWTVRHLPTARQPYLIIVGSALGRLGMSVVGFYVVVRGGSWVHLLVCLGGFLGARSLLIRYWRSERMPLAVPKEVPHGYHAD